MLAGDLITSQILNSEEFNLKKCDQLVPSCLSQGIAASLFNRFSCKIIAPNLGSVIHTHTPMAQNREPGQEEQKLAVALAEKCKELRLIG